MSETNSTGIHEADPEDELSKVAFSISAVHADKVLVTERGGIVRIAVVETDLSGALHARGAIAVALPFAETLSEILKKIVENSETRKGAVNEPE